MLQRNPTSAGDSAAYERRSSSADDVVIVSALRTPICRVGRELLDQKHNKVTVRSLTMFRYVQAKRGGLKDTLADDLMTAVFKATIQQTGIEPGVCCELCNSMTVLSVYAVMSSNATETCLYQQFGTMQ